MRVEEKSVYLLKELISRFIKIIINRYTKIGDIVCDLVMGVGSTAVAAIELQRRFVGGDKDEKVVNVAIKRVFTSAEHLINTSKIYSFIHQNNNLIN